MEKEKLYHIHKKGINDEIWYVGNTITFDYSSFNSFFSKCLNFDSMVDIDNQKYPFKNVLDYCCSNDMDINKIELLSVAYNIIDEYQILVRELGMEEVRKKIFNNLPSRHNCIWLCRIDQISFWCERLSENYDIYEVEIFDKPFKSRNLLLPLPADSYKTILEKSRTYWSYSNDELNEDDEYLYIGKIRIIRKIEI